MIQLAGPRALRASSRVPVRQHLGQQRPHRLQRRVHVQSGEQLEFWQGEDFYQIIGVSPDASPRQIKAAYHRLMKEFHPDSGNEYDTTDFCALLNEIYAALSDPAARTMYDAIAGFSTSSVNPFTDTSYPADQVFVDEVSCIGCGKCVRACPEVFQIEASKYGRARVIAQPPTHDEAAAEEVEVAILTCPVDCIHWVTSPQLNLLEGALAGMERVDAFIMLRSCRSPGNVFHEAARAWSKRQSSIQALRRQQAEERAYAAAAHQTSSSSSSPGAGGFGSAWASFWSQHVDFDPQHSAAGPAPPPGPDEAAGEDEGAWGGGGTAGGGKGARRMADLAAAAARASRMWRMYHALAQPAKALSE